MIIDRVSQTFVALVMDGIAAGSLESSGMYANRQVWWLRYESEPSVAYVGVGLELGVE